MPAYDHTAGVEDAGPANLAPPRVGRARSGTAKAVGPRPARVELSSPQDVLHCMLFIFEYAASVDPRWTRQKRNLDLFLSRSGGFHLLLMLLNAYYNKPPAGRDPGWVFRGIRDRIDISERALRMLINDAIAAGLVVRFRGRRDRRCRKYRLTPQVVEAWETLATALRTALPDVFAQFGTGALANVDYRHWNLDLPACDQIEAVPPSRRHLLRPAGR